MQSRDSISVKASVAEVARGASAPAVVHPSQPVEVRRFSSSFGRCVGEIRERLLHRRAVWRQLSEGERLLKASDKASVEPALLAAWIRPALHSPVWEVRNVAVKLIPRTNDPSLFALLVDRAGERHEAGIVRRNALTMLREANYWTPAARAAALACFDDHYWEVRSEAVATFAFFERPSPETEAAALSALRRGERRAQGRRSIRERNFEVRASCARALGALAATPEGVSVLALLANDLSWIVRYQAAVALAEVALRQANLRARACEGFCRVHISAEGAVPHHPCRERLGALRRRLMELEQSGPQAARSFYLDLKSGWNVSPR